MDDEWTIKKWLVTSEPRVVYIKPEDVHVCILEKNSGWKPEEKRIIDYKETLHEKTRKPRYYDDFDGGFDNMMSSSLKYEWLIG